MHLDDVRLAAAGDLGRQFGKIFVPRTWFPDDLDPWIIFLKAVADPLVNLVPRLTAPPGETQRNIPLRPLGSPPTCCIP
jgi:hypothetical protein